MRGSAIGMVVLLSSALATGAVSAAEAGAMVYPRFDHTATLLADGRVLLAGGEMGDGTLVTAEVLDPTTATFTETGRMASDRSGHAAARLPDGRVLVIGGFDAHGEAPGEMLDQPWAEKWDPATGEFEAIRLPVRLNSSILTLHDGRLLVSRRGRRGVRVRTFDPASGELGRAAWMPGSEARVLAASMPGGRVLVVPAVSNMDERWGAWVYEPGSGALEEATPSSVARPGPIPVGLSDGRVLLLPGFGDDPAYLFDPDSGSVVDLGSPPDFRLRSLPALLADGRVLALGEDLADQPAAVTFDPASLTFSSVGPPTTLRAISTLTNLADGRMLVTGGSVTLCEGFGALATAEVFDPTSDTFRALGPEEPEPRPTPDLSECVSGG